MVDEIKLGRIGHYHTPGAAGTDGSCQTAIVAKVWGPAMVNLVYWEQGDGDQGFRSSVAVVAPESTPNASFHLNRDCPFDR